MPGQSSVTTFLFTDIEGSTRLWEQESERMRPALARHDAIVRAAVESNRGMVVKMSGDGLHAAFDDPLDAIHATMHMQRALEDPASTHGIALRVRCGLHAGIEERRDNDFFGVSVNRAARIMSAAHGGQILVSQAVAELLRDRLPKEISLRDLGSVRLRDLINPERVFQIVHPSLRQDFPALRSLEATPNNLPQQVTSFIGRESELSEIKALLRNSRLVTLVGTGGLGKTRISIQAAADVMDEYPDGVWFIELAALKDESLLPQVVASVVGIKEEAGYEIIDALTRYCSSRRVLLILDNCEHLVGACAHLVAHLLQAGPHLKILASSRENLRVRSESTYSVPALAVPGPEATPALAMLSQFEAVRLFADRATAVQFSFQVTEANVVAVAQICRRLDGIPLAIELAAARVRSLSVAQISARLSDWFRLLTSGDATSLPRQQTLQASIDWSYDLLSEDERTLFRRLAVFAGGWTMEAAEAIGAGGDIRNLDVLELLTRLVEKSLVVLEADGERYTFLETVRQYSLRRLEASHEAYETRSRHLSHYLALAEIARPELIGANQGVWLSRLDVERENLLEAHAWCDRAEQGGDLGLRLVYLLKPYWITRGLVGLGHQATIYALNRKGAQDRNAARCRGLFDAGQLECVMGRYREAQALLEDSLSIAREINDKRRIAAVLQPLGIAHLGQGNLGVAGRYFEDALAMARELGDKRQIAAALNALAQFHRVEGKLAIAEQLYEQMLSSARELEDRELVAVGLLNLAMVSIGNRDDARGRNMVLEALEIADEIGSHTTGQSVLEVAAGLATLRTEWEQSARFFGAARAQATRTGLRRDPADEALLAPLLANAREALGLTAFATADAGGYALPYENAMAEARQWLVASSA